MTKRAYTLTFDSQIRFLRDVKPSDKTGQKYKGQIIIIAYIQTKAVTRVLQTKLDIECL